MEQCASADGVEAGEKSPKRREDEGKDSSRNETGAGYREGQGTLLIDRAVWPDSFASRATTNSFVTVAKFKFRLIMSHLRFFFLHHRWKLRMTLCALIGYQISTCDCVLPLESNMTLSCSSTTSHFCINESARYVIESHQEYLTVGHCRMCPRCVRKGGQGIRAFVFHRAAVLPVLLYVGLKS